MHRSLDCADLERRTIAAHGFYVAALAWIEALQDALRRGAPGITGDDVMLAECELAARRAELLDLLNALGYLPEDLTTKLPGSLGTGNRRPTAASDPDLAALLRTYLNWRACSRGRSNLPSERSMRNLGRILTLLGLLPDETSADTFSCRPEPNT